MVDEEVKEIKSDIKLSVSRAFERTIAFHPAFARIGGSVKAGLFLSQLYYWSDKGRIGGGWVYKDHKEWTRETCLTQDEQRGARRELLKRNLILESNVRELGIDKYSSTLAFRIDFDVFFNVLRHDDEIQHDAE